MTIVSRAVPYLPTLNPAGLLYFASWIILECTSSLEWTLSIVCENFDRLHIVSIVTFLLSTAGNKNLNLTNIFVMTSQCYMRWAVQYNVTNLAYV
jgi:hypothetical protein